MSGERENLALGPGPDPRLVAAVRAMRAERESLPAEVAGWREAMREAGTAALSRLGDDSSSPAPSVPLSGAAKVTAGAVFLLGIVLGWMTRLECGSGSTCGLDCFCNVLLLVGLAGGGIAAGLTLLAWKVFGLDQLFTRGLSPDERARAVEAVLSGEGPEQVAAAFRLSEGTLLRWVDVYLDAARIELKVRFDPLPAD